MKKNTSYFSLEKSSIPSNSPVITAISLLASLSMAAAAQTTVCPVDESQLDGSGVPIPDTMLSEGDSLLTKSLSDQAISSKTYASVAASLVTNGPLYSGGAITLGTTAYIGGNVDSGAVITLGAGAIVEGFAKATDPRTEERL
ncbi:MAG: hypothetical protein ACJAVK_000673 [Akkermansiaceae bacterium]|jgi:hypothetical protein